ncbi:lipoprotein [Prevotella sp. CAG:1058]|nr:lipoprotein [Prevotella sp. CAG:1058]
MKNGVVLVFVACLCMVLWTTGCSDKKPVAADTLAVDSLQMVDTASVDTLDELISEQPMPKAADELFDDFIFNFAANRKLQLGRIKFPLEIVDGENVAYLKKKQWKMEHFFMDQGYYTLIFDNMKQMNVVKDTSINNVVVEKVYLAKEKVEKYIFKRINGRWMLTSVHTNDMVQNTNASFLAFYQKFASDPSFQIESLNNPVMFTGPDPDDDFSTMTGEIAPETWPAFAPELPSDFIYNIMYGQKYTEGNQKIFVMRGIANGMEMQLTFKRMDGKWKLTSLSE